MAFVKFMTSGMGRVARIVLGLVILSVGLFVVKGAPGSMMALVALIPISGGLFDFCLIGFALGYPLKGESHRRESRGPRVDPSRTGPQLPRTGPWRAP